MTVRTKTTKVAVRGRTLPAFTGQASPHTSSCAEPPRIPARSSGPTALLAAHRARDPDDRTVLSAAGSPCSTPCVVGRYEQSVRSTVVEVADQAATSSLGKR